jgi:hypothetical protein
LNEIKAVQGCGMMNWQIITTSTLDEAKVQDKEKEFGIIAEEKNASPVLVECMLSSLSLVE